MTTFLDKLKKGMGEAEEIPQKKPELEEILQEEPSEEKPIKKESIEKESKEEKSTKKKIFKKKRIKKEKTIKKEEEKEDKIEFKKIKVDEEPPSFAQARKEGDEEKNWLEPKGQLTVDVYQTDKDFIVQSAIAGVQTKDLDISVDNDMLIIRGVREKPFEEEEGIYSYQECFWGPFSREIILPEEVDCSRIEASLKEGVLTIRVPKIKRRAQRKITVE